MQSSGQNENAGRLFKNKDFQDGDSRALKPRAGPFWVWCPGREREKAERAVVWSSGVCFQSTDLWAFRPALWSQMVLWVSWEVRVQGTSRERLRDKRWGTRCVWPAILFVDAICGVNTFWYETFIFLFYFSRCPIKHCKNYHRSPHLCLPLQCCDWKYLSVPEEKVGVMVCWSWWITNSPEKSVPGCSCVWVYLKFYWCERCVACDLQMMVLTQYTIIFITNFL